MLSNPSRPWPLRHHNQHRRLTHSRKANPFSHEGKTSTGGRDDGRHAGEGGSNGHIDGGNLVLGLFHHQTHTTGVSCQIECDGCSWRHGIKGTKFHSCGECTHGNGLITVYQQPLARFVNSRQFWKIHYLLTAPLESFCQHLLILLSQLMILLSKYIIQGLSQQILIQSQKETPHP